MLKNFLMDEDGQGMVEYALIIGLISIVVIVALGVIGTQVNRHFEEVGDTLGNVNPGEAA